MIQKTKSVPLDEGTFQLSKWSPDAAFYWAAQLIGHTFGAAGGGKGISEESIPAMIQSFLLMQRDQMTDLQRDCLKCVAIQLPTGVFPLLRENGTHAKELSNPTLFNLTVQAFAFNISDFFAPGVLKALIEGLVGALPEHITEALLKASESSSTSPSQKDTGDSMSSGTEPTP